MAHDRELADASIAAVMRKANAVVKCVGILNKSGKNNFDARPPKGRTGRSIQNGLGTWISTSSALAGASSSSTPRYRTVL
ncbi:hypothetical protein [Arenibacterium sp. CAU 1754]